MKSYKTLSRFMAIILAVGLVMGNLWIAPPPAYAAPASALATQIAGIDGGALTATLNALDPSVIDVTGTASVTSTVNLNIDRNVTVNWGADLVGSTASGKYMLNLSGGGTFNLVDGADLSNNSGIITVTGEGANLLIAEATLTTPSAGNGLSVNVAAGDVSVTIGAKGSIINNGTNSAVNVTAGVRGVRINVNGGSVKSEPSGYAINDGGTALCTNDTLITVNSGEVMSGSACAIKSTGADSAVVILGGTVTNAATVNSNPVIYMNGGLGNNVTVGGTGKVESADNNLGFGIQTTGNVMIMDQAEVRATKGRAVNLVGMDSEITVNGGLVSATTGIAICTATTNPASVANASITINGGVVSTGDPYETDKESVDHGAGRAIYATGEHNVVTVNGGWVYTTWDLTEAIYITGTGSKAVVNGGWVSARNHFAIEAYNGGSAYINGGFVFAYGDEPLIPKTGAKIYSSAVGAISESRIILNGFDAAGNLVIDEYADNSGNGVVVAWDRELWMKTGSGEWNEAKYTEGEATHLAAKPSGLISGMSLFGVLSGVSLPDFLSGDDSLDSTEDEDIENLTDDPDPSALVEDADQTALLKDADPSELVTDDEPSGLAGDSPLANFEGIKSLSDFTEETETPLFMEGTSEFDEVETGEDSAASMDGDLMTSTEGNPVAAPVEGDEAPDTGADEDSLETEESDGAPSPEGLMMALGLAPFADPNAVHWHANGGLGFDGVSYHNGDNVGFFPVIDVGGSSDAVEVVPPIPPHYSLTVLNGAGSGVYTEGDTVSIAANPPLIGKEFDCWFVREGDGVTFLDAYADTTSFLMPGNTVTVEAVYKDMMYTLTVTGGTGGGSYLAGAPVSITAGTPTIDKEFAYWAGADDSLFASAFSAATVFQMPAANTSISAIYQDAPRYLFSLSGGSVISSSVPATGGKYPAGTVITINAPSAFPAGYSFSGWSVKSGGGAFVEEEAFKQFGARFIMPAADSYVELSQPYSTKPASHVLEVVNGVDRTGGASYSAGMKVTIEANPPAEGKVFTGWSIAGGRGLFAEAGAMSTTFLMSDTDASVRANYADIEHPLFVEYGEITGDAGSKYAGKNAGRFVTGEEIPLVAKYPDVPPNGAIRYKFDGWTVSGGGNLDNPGGEETTFTMPDGDVVVTAHWTPIYRLVVLNGQIVSESDDPNWGFFEAGDTVDIEAISSPGSGYAFGGWQSVVGGAFVDAREESTKFTMPDNDVLIVAFHVYTGGSGHFLTLVYNIDGSATTTTYAAGEKIEITADPAPVGYAFTGWTSYSNGGALNEAGEPNTNYGTIVDATSSPTTFIMPDQDVTVTANYAEVFKLEVDYDGDGLGLLEDKGSFTAGSRIPIEATLATDRSSEGLLFAGWASKDGEFDNASLLNTTFIMPASHAAVTATYTAIVEQRYALTTINCHSDSYGPFTGTGSETVVITADEPAGKQFSHWEIDGYTDPLILGNRSVSTPISFAMPENNVTVTAVLDDINYSLTVENGTGTGRYSAGELAPITASPAPSGKIFDRWVSVEGGGSFDSQSRASTGFLMPANDVTVTAMYKDAPAAPRMPYTSSGSASSVVTPVAVGLRGDVSALLNTKEHMAYVGGIGNHLFAPDKDMTRAETAQMFYNLLLDKNVKPSRTFSDVQAQAWYKTAVDTLASLGIIAGRTDGRFAPEDGITRAEFVSIAVRFTEETLGDKQAASFSDVPQNHWAYGSIVTAESYGWIGGVGDGRFDPDRHISRAEVITMTNRMLLRVPDKAAIDSLTTLLLYTDVPKTHWAFYEIEEASNTHRFAKSEDGASETWTQDSDR